VARNLRHAVPLMTQGDRRVAGHETVSLPSTDRRFCGLHAGLEIHSHRRRRSGQARFSFSIRFKTAILPRRRCARCPGRAPGAPSNSLLSRCRRKLFSANRGAALTTTPHREAPTSPMHPLSLLKTYARAQPNRTARTDGHDQSRLSRPFATTHWNSSNISPRNPFVNSGCATLLTLERRITGPPRARRPPTSPRSASEETRKQIET